MRGPGLKVALDVRRTWRCAACGYERRVDGRQTAVRCGCGEGRFMKLVATPRVERPTNRPVDVYFDAEALLASLGEPPVEGGAAITASATDGIVVEGATPATLETPAESVAATGFVGEAPAARAVDDACDSLPPVSDRVESPPVPPAERSPKDRPAGPSAVRPREQPKRNPHRGKRQDRPGGDRRPGPDPAK